MITDTIGRNQVSPLLMETCLACLVHVWSEVYPFAVFFFKSHLFCLGQYLNSHVSHLSNRMDSHLGNRSTVPLMGSSLLWEHNFPRQLVPNASAWSAGSKQVQRNRDPYVVPWKWTDTACNPCCLCLLPLLPSACVVETKVHPPIVAANCGSLQDPFSCIRRYRTLLYITPVVLN